MNDIISGLLVVGAHGAGDEYGLGADESYSVKEIAELFGTDIKMLDERPGNRMDATLDVDKAKFLGWEAKHSLKDYIRKIVEPD